jgi:hypothetical protein
MKFAFAHISLPKGEHNIRCPGMTTAIGSKRDDNYSPKPAFRWIESVALSLP